LRCIVIFTLEHIFFSFLTHTESI